MTALTVRVCGSLPDLWALVAVVFILGLLTGAASLAAYRTRVRP